MPKVVDHEARRSELSSVAASLIAEGGLEAATIREIAACSGYSRGVVEHYFDDKQQLISAALDSANQRYEKRVTKATAGRVGLEALRARILATLPTSQAQRNEWKVRLVFWSLAAIEPELRQRQRLRFGRAIKSFQGDIELALSGLDPSAAADSATRARRVVHMTTGISVAALHNIGFYDRARLVAEAENLVAMVMGRRQL